MLVFSTIASFEAYISTFTKPVHTIGFVPTMGALHQGHISLIISAIAENDICVASIFVNPTQFNNTEDLAKYPHTPEADIAMLRAAGCHALFMPTASEVYAISETKPYFDWGYLGNVLEGSHRPGHFDGVGQIVGKLLGWCKPTKAYFGLKDYQQYLIVKKLTADMGLATQIIGCPILREADGLAMSSRNTRLSPHDRAEAVLLYNTLLWIKANATLLSTYALEQEAAKRLQNHESFTIEYVSIRQADTLAPCNPAESPQNAIALLAAYIGGVRLIDNMAL